MRDLHVFSPGALYSGLDRKFCQHARRLPLVFSRASHVGRWLRNVYHRLAYFLDGLRA